MVSKKTKMTIGAISGIVLVIVIGTFILMPNLWESIGALITGQVSSCEDTPYDAKCICEVGIERKISVPWLGIPRWDCEVLEDLLIDPESPTFESDAILFAEEYLSRWCGSIATDFTCGTTDCVQGNPTFPNNRCISAGFGYGANGERIVNVECIEVTEWDEQNRPTSGRIPWRMQFYVESTTGTPKTMFPESNYYYNESTGQKCTEQSVCDYYYANPSQYTIDNPNWCVGDLPLDVIPYIPDPTLSIAGGKYTDPAR